jgi:hypothetical protein
MNCQDFEPTILSMARAQLLEASARRQTIAHIAECPACADRLAEQQALTAAVRATAKSLRDEAASAHIEQSLRAAFRKQTSAAPTFSRSTYSPARKWQWPKLAAAAAIVLLFLLAGAIRQWSLAGRNQKTATVQPSPPVTKENEKLPESLMPTDRPERKAPRQVASERRRTGPLVRRGATSSEEAVTEFIALASENQLVPLESGQVLRVELSTSTLISMGLRVTAEDVSKPVLADLLVGQDGVPRAIRFVRSGEASDSGSLENSTNK